MKKEIHFIINPISGSGKHKMTNKNIVDQLGVENYNIHIETTQYKNHATELAQNAIEKKSRYYSCLWWRWNH